MRTPTKVHKLRAMTMIDPATGWFEIAPVIHPDSNTTPKNQKTSKKSWTPWKRVPLFCQLVED